jgi:hypothetical protein
VGFMTDGASIPRVFWGILAPWQNYAEAAVIHDYLYTSKIKSKKEADNIFLEGMKTLGVNIFERRIMYWAVWAFGGRHYFK